MTSSSGRGVRAALLGVVLVAACGGGSTGAAPNAADAGPSSGAADAAVAHPAIGPDAGAWKALAPLPAARQETAVVELGGKIYVIGGFDASPAVVSDVTVYDPAADAWSAARPLPAPIHHANAATVGGKLYVGRRSADPVVTWPAAA